MKSFEEYEQFVVMGGDMLFACLLTVTGSREKSLEIMAQASEKFLDSRVRTKNSNERYRLMAKYCMKTLGGGLPKKPDDARLTDDEREKLFTSARLYITSGGKAKKRLWLIITVGVFLVILAIIIAISLGSILSEEFDLGWSEWYNKEEQFRNQNGWGH